MKPVSIVKLKKSEIVKLELIDKFADIPKELKAKGLAFPEKFKSGVVVDKQGSPKYFIFDTYSLWDLLCAFDAKYEENVSDKEYIQHNPVGWLIDAIESHLPVNPRLVSKLKKGIAEAERLGYISFEKLKRKLGLS